MQLFLKPVLLPEVIFFSIFARSLSSLKQIGEGHHTGPLDLIGLSDKSEFLTVAVKYTRDYVNKNKAVIFTIFTFQAFLLLLF